MTFSILLTIEKVFENERQKTTIFSTTFSNPGKIEKAIENESQCIENYQQNKKRTCSPKETGPQKRYGTGSVIT